MEVVSFLSEVMQNLAEQAASYRFGQAALRHLDRALWVVEKCARWAVPPPLDQDDHPQPELVRPLPWVFFLTMLVALRITRETISLVNLAFGKPPLRSADVVIYIQSKRRYLRTLKYQGTRIHRTRSTSQRESWFSSLQSLFEFTMCFRRSHYGNNNTTRVSNNDEVLVVRRNKRGRETAVASTSETTMERLIEKMMVDLDAESDDDASFTLTNATSVRSDETEDSETEQEPSEGQNASDKAKSEGAVETDANNVSSETKVDTQSDKRPDTNETSNSVENSAETGTPTGKTEHSEPKPEEKTELTESNEATNTEKLEEQKTKHPSEETQKFIDSERCSPQKSQQSPKNTKIGMQSQRPETSAPDEGHAN